MSESVILKGSDGIRAPFLNLCLFGDTNAGKTHFLMSYVRSQKKRMVIINADVEENFVRNFNDLTPEQRKRILQPHQEDVSGLQIGSVPAIRKIVDQILSGPINKLINSGQIELIAVDGIDAVLATYEKWFFDTRVDGNPTPFDYGRARDIFMREFLLPLIQQPCHFIATTNFETIYPPGAKQFDPPVEVYIGGKKVNAHGPKLPARFWKYFTTMVELRQLNPFKEREVKAFFVKSKKHQGLFGYQLLPSASKDGLTFADYLKYVKENFE